MRYRRFGKTNLTVSEVGFGCARIGGVFQGMPRSEIIRLLRRSLDVGITFYDTADMYTQGESERLLGEALGAERQRVVIATKVGYRLPTRKLLINYVKPLVRPVLRRLRVTAQQVHAGLRGAVSRQEFSPEYIVKAAEASLRRLRTDYIDIYQLHDPPLEVLKSGEFVQTLEQLKQQGKIREWGVACAQPQDALASLQYDSLGAIQVSVSVLEQAALESAIPRAAERGIGIIARQVFASGLLTRDPDRLKLEDIDTDPEVAQFKLSRIRAHAAAAARQGRTPGELALEFALKQPQVSVALLGMSQSSHLSMNLEAIDAIQRSSEEQPRVLTRQ